MTKIVSKMATKYWLYFRSTNLQAPNPKQYPNSNDPNGFVSEFGPAFGGIGDYLEFGIWILGFQTLFGSSYVGLGLCQRPFDFLAQPSLEKVLHPVLYSRHKTLIGLPPF
jgi:hypothetical protein